MSDIQTIGVLILGIGVFFISILLWLSYWVQYYQIKEFKNEEYSDGIGLIVTLYPMIILPFVLIIFG